MNEETIIICGFHFHIQWYGDRGADQHANIWIKDPEPRFEDPNKLDNVLDVYNGINKYMSGESKLKGE